MLDVPLELLLDAQTMLTDLYSRRKDTCGRKGGKRLLARFSALELFPLTGNVRALRCLKETPNLARSVSGTDKKNWMNDFKIQSLFQ